MNRPFVRDGFVFNLHEDLQPLYRLNPFSTEQLGIDSSNQFVDSIDKTFSQRYEGRPYVYTANGRQAIREALRLLNLTSDDCVTILTPTNNYYISSCVTNEINVFCQWSRYIEPHTKVIFVNHEFGVPYPNLLELKKIGLPIIEDCCYSFYSATKENMMGCVGDYIVYSFAKYFPVQFGGLLVGPAEQQLPMQLLDGNTELFLKKEIERLYPQAEAIAAQRYANHAVLIEKLAPFGILPRFNFATEGVPGVFMFVPPASWHLPTLKDFLWSCGIHCSVFYGEHAFFIPVHQGLSDTALEYFTVCISQFANKQNNSL